MYSNIESLPIKRRSLWSNSHEEEPGGASNENVVIYAQVGDTVNISCRFDPKLFAMAAANRRGGSSSVRTNNNDLSYYMYKRKRRSETRSHHRRRHDTTLYEKFVKQHHNKPSSVHNKHQVDDHNGDASYQLRPMNDENLNDDDSIDLNEMPQVPLVNNEIDWYFSDNRGRMNIISYGNQTISNLRYKYKIYTQADTPPSPADSSSESPSSLSALYSQQLSSAASSSSLSPPPSGSRSASSSQLYKHHHHNQRNHNNHQQHQQSHHTFA